jgi:hypothetical protein
VIHNLRLFYPDRRPDLGSVDYVALLREVVHCQSWVRLTLGLIGGLLVIGIGLLIFLNSAPERYLRVLNLPVLHGRFTIAGWAMCFILTGFGLFALFVAQNLRKDIQPYSLPATILGRYVICEGRITGFRTPVEFGSRWDKYQRLSWVVDGPMASHGKTPYVHEILSIWLDLNDPVYIGLDPANEYPPIFLGVHKKAPDVLLEEPVSHRKVYLAIRERLLTNPRFKGVYVGHLWDLKKDK